MSVVGMKRDLLPLTPKPLKSFSQSAHERGKQGLSNFEMLKILTWYVLTILSQIVAY